MRSIDAVYDMLRGVDGFQLEELAGESMCTDMAHPTGVFDLHGSWNSCKPNTVRELVGRNEWDEGPIASRDEIIKAWRLRGYSGKWW